MESLIAGLVLLATAGMLLCAAMSVAGFLIDQVREAATLCRRLSPRAWRLRRPGVLVPAALSLGTALVAGAAAIQTSSHEAQALPDAGCVGQPAGALDEIRPYHEGLAAARRGTAWGFIDTQGRIAVPFRFWEVRDFHEGMAAVRVRARWGFVDARGRLAIPPRYQAVRSFSEDRAAVYEDGLWGYLDTEGRLVVEPSYLLAGPFVGGRARVAGPDFAIGEIGLDGRLHTRLWSPPPTCNAD